MPRGDLERIEKAMRRVEQTVREADEKRWASRNPEAAARAQSLVDQLESAVEGLRADLVTAQASGNERVRRTRGQRWRRASSGWPRLVQGCRSSAAEPVRGPARACGPGGRSCAVTTVYAHAL